MTASTQLYRTEFNYVSSSNDGNSHTFNTETGYQVGPELKWFSKTTISHTHLITVATILGESGIKRQFTTLQREMNDHKIEHRQSTHQDLSLFEGVLLTELNFVIPHNESNASDVIDRIVCEDRAKKMRTTYSIPNFEDFMNHYAEALSRFHNSPDEDKMIITRKDTWKLACNLMDDFDISCIRSAEQTLSSGLERFQKRIQKFTTEAVRIAYADPKRFQKTLTGPAVYLELTIGSESRPLIAGPHSHPFQIQNSIPSSD